MSPRLSDGAGDSLISRDRRDRDGSSARLGGQGAFCPWVRRPLALLLQGWAAEPHAAPGVGTSPGSWRGTVPAVLSGVAALHRLWQWSGREARAGKGQEKFPAAGEVPSCRGISHLSSPGRLHLRKAALTCWGPALWGAGVCSVQFGREKPHRKFTSIFTDCSSLIQSSLAFTEAAARAFCSPSKTQVSTKAPAAHRSCVWDKTRAQSSPCGLLAVLGHTEWPN